MAQFAMVAYYMLGGPYSILMGSNVRMDLFYGNWSLRRKATVDSVTVLFLIFYLGVMLYGAFGSTAYSLGYWGSEPMSFFAGLLTGSEENRSYGALFYSVAPLHLANKGHHDCRSYSDAAAGTV